MDPQLMPGQMMQKVFQKTFTGFLIGRSKIFSVPSSETSGLNYGRCTAALCRIGKLSSLPSNAKFADAIRRRDWNATSESESSAESIL
jgi:hypothetical protein